jgi:hypothetical protein
MYRPHNKNFISQTLQSLNLTYAELSQVLRRPYGTVFSYGSGFRPITDEIIEEIRALNREVNEHTRAAVNLLLKLPPDFRITPDVVELPYPLTTLTSPLLTKSIEMRIYARIPVVVRLVPQQRKGAKIVSGFSRKSSSKVLRTPELH